VGRKLRPGLAFESRPPEAAEEGRSVELADLAATIGDFVRTRHAEYE
jgi:hypothetical protein